MREKMTKSELARLVSRIGVFGAVNRGAFDEAFEQPETEEPIDSFTNMLTKNLFGRHYSEATTSVMTYNTVMELESEFIGFRIGIHNIAGTAVTGVKACVAVRDKVDYNTADSLWMAETSLSGGTWIDCTFGGATTATLAPALGTERTSITWSDLIPIPSLARIDGGVRPIIQVRIEFPSGAQYSRPANGIARWRTMTTPRYLRVSRQAVGGVTDKAAYTEVANRETGICIPAVQYYTKKKGKQFLIVGDSIREGVNGTPNGVGAAQLLAYRHSTPDSPIDYFNGAIHAQPPMVYSPRVNDMLDVVKPTHVFYGVWSGNDVAVGGISADALNRARMALANVIGWVRGARTPTNLILDEGTPTSTAYKAVGAADSRRVDFNKWLESFTGLIPAKGFANAVSVGADATGQIQINPAMTADGVHPNLEGYNALADVLEPLVFPSKK